MSRLREFGKSVFEVAAEVSGVRAFGARQVSTRAVVLAYHNVVSDALARKNASAHLAVSSFTLQMEYLAKNAHVVPLHNILDDYSFSDAPRVAITFDDGYRGAFRHAVPALESFGFEATFFICPGLVGGPSFWWDIEGVNPWADRHELLHIREGRRERVMPVLEARGFVEAHLDEEFNPADLSELRQYGQRKGVTIGSHTISHPNLTSLDTRDIRTELETSLAWIRACGVNHRPLLSYPFGLSSTIVRKTAREVGYEAAVSVTGGWIDPLRYDRFNLPRLNIPARLSLRGFRLRMANILAS